MQHQSADVLTAQLRECARRYMACFNSWPGFLKAWVPLVNTFAWGLVLAAELRVFIGVTFGV